MLVAFKSAGFTLVELLVVLAVVATLGAMTGPDLWKGYQTAHERTVVLDFGGKLTEMRRELLRRGGSLSVDIDKLGSHPSSLIPDPALGWTIEGNTAMYFLPTGVTNGGEIYLSSPRGTRWLLSLAALDGKIEVARQ